MIIRCFRCGKEINTPNSSNADYVIADDMVAKEVREALFALKHNPATRMIEAKMEETETVIVNGAEIIHRKYPDLAVADDEYDAVEIPNIAASKGIGKDLAKVKAEMREKDIQKTGIICSECHKVTDFVIWGVHKKGTVLR